MQEPNKTFPNGVVIIRAKNEQVISTIVDVVLRHANNKEYGMKLAHLEQSCSTKQQESTQKRAKCAGLVKIVLPITSKS